MFVRGICSDFYSFLGAPNFIVIISFTLLYNRFPYHIHALIEQCERCAALHQSCYQFTAKVQQFTRFETGNASISSILLLCMK
jgi:hypothetical protein